MFGVTIHLDWCESRCWTSRAKLHRQEGLFGIHIPDSRWTPCLLFCRWRTTPSWSPVSMMPSATTSVKVLSRSAARRAARSATRTRTVHVGAKDTAWSTPTAALLSPEWPAWTWWWSEPRGCGATTSPRRTDTWRFSMGTKEPRRRWSGTTTSPPGTTWFALRRSTCGTGHESTRSDFR